MVSGGGVADNLKTRSFPSPPSLSYALLSAFAFPWLFAGPIATTVFLSFSYSFSSTKNSLFFSLSLSFCFFQEQPKKKILGEYNQIELQFLL